MQVRVRPNAPVLDRGGWAILLIRTDRLITIDSDTVQRETFERCKFSNYSNWKTLSLFEIFNIRKINRVGGAIMRHLALYPYNGGKKKNFSV